MKNFLYLSIGLIALIACNKTNTIPGPPDTEPSTIEPPFNTSKVDMSFIADTAVLDIVGDSWVTSVENSVEWISYKYTGDGKFSIYVSQNEQASHRTDSIKINFNTGKTFNLTVSQNAYPYMEITDDYLDDKYVYITLDIGEDVSDIRVLATNKYILDSNGGLSFDGMIQYMLTCGNYIGTVYTLEDYMTAIEENGVLAMKRPDDMTNFLHIHGLALDDEGNYVAYPMLSYYL